MANNSDAQTGPQPALESNPSNPSTRVPSYLGAGLAIKGQIIGDEDLKIDGKMEGPVSLANHRFTVGSTAHVAGEVAAREIIVYGNVKGKLSAQDRIEIKKDSSVLGDMTTPRVMIEDGAYFKGAIEIERSATKVAMDPNTLLALAEKDFKMKSIRSADTSRSEQSSS
jgi:cytoskeletal protein CcmA (bactofilin family)